MANSVYDDDDKLPGNELADNRNTPLDAPSSPIGEKKSSDSSLDEARQGEKNPAAPKSKDSRNSGGLSPSMTAAREAAMGVGAGRALPKGFSPSLDRMEKLDAFLGRNKKRGLIGGGATGVIVSLVLLAFFVMIPLKIESIVNGMQKHFMASSEQAIGTETQNMLERYMVNHVLPDYKRCGTTLSKDCSVSIATSPNPVTAMYRAWSQNKLENTLATNYGIEFKYDRAANTWYLKSPNNPGKGDNIGADGSKIDDVFQRADRAGMRAAIDDALEGATRWKKIHMRFQVAKLLDQKYGVRFCNLYCGKADQLGEFKDEKSRAFQILLTQRVIGSHDVALSIVMECLISSCDAETTQTTTPEEGSTGELNGAPENSNIDTKLRQELTARAATFGITDKETVDKMVQDAKDIREKGGTSVALDKVMEKLGLSAFSDKVTDAVPIIGWINTGAGIVNGAHNLGPLVRKGSAAVGYATAIPAATLLLSYRDEIHTGHINATEVGSIVNSFGAGKTVNGKEPVGGKASAEKSPLYQAVFSQQATPTTASLLSGILPGKASAATASADTDNQETCEDGNPVPTAQLVCSNVKIGHGIGAADNVSSFLETPGINVITAAAGAIKGFTGAFGDIFGSIFSAIPGLVGGITGLVSGPIQSVLTGGITKLIPSSTGNGNLSGARNIEIAGTGFEAIGKDACIQVGCQETDSATAMKVINQQVALEKQQFTQKPYFARMFDTSSSYSMVTRLAMATPLNLQASAQSGMASVMSNPFGSLLHGLSSLIPGAHASAALNVDSADPANIGAAYFPAGAIPKDAEAYWDANNCGDTSDSGPVAKWQKAASDGTKNPNTGMPVYTTPQPCLLVHKASAAAGAVFDTGLLSTDEQQTLTGGSSSDDSSPTTPAGVLPSGDAKELAGQLKQYLGNKIKCNDQAQDCPDIKGTADGTSIKNGSCNVDALDAKLLGMILKLVQMGHVIVFSALCSDHPTNPNSLHHQGKAADFNYIDGIFLGLGEDRDGTIPWTPAKVTVGKKLDQDVVSFMPKGSVGFGQKQCHAEFSFFTGYNVIEDGCHHQHIQIEN